MKHCLLAILLCCLLLFCGSAIAEEESSAQQAQMPLFTAGEIPPPMRMRSTVPEGFEAFIVEQLRSQPESIKVLSYGMQPEAFVMALSNIINDHPDLFYIGPSVRYTTGATSGNVYNYFPEYLYTGADLQNRIAAFEHTVSEIAGYAKSVSANPLAQMLAVNDYFCIHYEYDDTLSIHGPDLLFSGGTGVCQAYMLGYAAVLDELGIPNTHATSYAMAHVWNLVELDGAWYHVDVTWNDPSDTQLMSRSRYFLLSDEGMSAASHHSWSAAYVAADTTYDDFFWQETFTPMGVSGEYIFYLNDDFTGGMRTICRWTIGAESAEPLHSFSIASSTGSYLTSSAYNPICADSSKVYFAARGDMYRMNHDGSNAELIRSGDDSAYIWSCWKDGNTIRMLVGNTAIQNTRVVEFPLDARLVLPAGTQDIRQEAFSGICVREIVLPEGVLSIGERAFADIVLLEAVNIPKSVSHIAHTAFDGSENVCLLVVPGSYGESYALENGIDYKTLS